MSNFSIAKFQEIFLNVNFLLVRIRIKHSSICPTCTSTSSGSMGEKFCWPVERVQSGLLMPTFRSIDERSHEDKIVRIQPLYETDGSIHVAPAMDSTEAEYLLYLHAHLCPDRRIKAGFRARRVPSKTELIGVTGQARHTAPCLCVVCADLLYVLWRTINGRER